MRLVRTINCFAALALVILGCKSRDYNATQRSVVEKTDGKILSTGPKITYGFHWNKESVARTNPNYILRNLASQGEKRLQDGNAAGSGLYLANDPFSSQEFGNTLIVVPIQPHSA